MSDQEFERLSTLTFDNSQLASVEIAQQIAQIITEKNILNQPTILGLATGSSPLGVYKELIRLHQQQGLSFKNVITFNLDEYYPMEKNHQESYFRYMHENLFNHIDIDLNNVNVPKGNLPLQEIQAFCNDYEAKIDKYGGLDIQILGIGRSGHIGFNEPGSTESSKTRLITLDPITRIDAASSFGGLDKVPRKAITMGIKTILKAKRIILMAWGIKKAQIVQKMIEGPITEQIPSTFLQKHENVQVYLDTSAASQLTRFTKPWLVRECDWRDDILVAKAVLWLSKETGLPILKLGDKYYNEYGLSDLILFKGSAFDLNIEIFNKIEKTITGWPGGKQINVENKDNHSNNNSYFKKVLVFAPRPNDELVGMGGTLMRLIKQNHDVYVVYQTSGSFGVTDADTRRYVSFVQQFNQQFNDLKADDTYNQIIQFLDKKKEEGDADIDQVRKVKAIIRKEEAFQSCRYVGVNQNNIHFLNMPFYETGKRQKNSITQTDVNKIKDIVEQIRPDMIFVNGEMTDPNGTTRTCLNCFFQAIQKIEDKSIMKECQIWLYRAAWNDWQIYETDMHVPLTEEQIENKRNAIFCHQSQKDNVLYKGDDKMEFWQRSEQRNLNKALELQQRGLASYYAVEVFQKYNQIDFEQKKKHSIPYVQI